MKKFVIYNINSPAAGVYKYESFAAPDSKHWVKYPSLNRTGHICKIVGSSLILIDSGFSCPVVVNRD